MHQTDPDLHHEDLDTQVQYYDMHLVNLSMRRPTAKLPMREPNEESMMMKDISPIVAPTKSCTGKTWSEEINNLKESMRYRGTGTGTGTVPYGNGTGTNFIS